MIEQFARPEGLWLFLQRQTLANGWDIPLPMLSLGPETASHVLAYVNHGRWVADCPEGDGGAILLSRAEPLFWCPVCANEAVGHQWRAVRFPPNMAAIEAALLQRRHPRSRNWVPGESVAQLLAENIEHGVEV